MERLYYTFLLLLLVVQNDSDYTTVPAVRQPVLLTLRWNQAYPEDSIEKSLTGLKWGLSYLGATLPIDTEGLKANDSLISLDPQKLGFDANALKQLEALHQKISLSEEYQQYKAIDLGRYISLLLGASQHYYQIAGTPKKLQDLLGGYRLNAEKGYVNRSSVSFKHRRIAFSEQFGFRQLFVAEEIDSVSGQILEYETIELLPNGQLRFGIFDKAGQRIDGADPAHSAAGKPAKCMWCHESAINPLFRVQKDQPGYMGAARLQQTLLAFRESNQKAKNNLIDGVVFSKTQEHTLTELLYISFMEPSAARLALEWNLPEPEVLRLLSGLPTHQHAEFPFLGKLYQRADADRRAPYSSLAVSSNVRELGGIEVNYLDHD